MKKAKSLIIFLFFGSILIANAQTLSLGGKDWKIKDVPDTAAAAFCVDWIPATVPGNIQADLESARLLKPLWYGAGDKRLYDVAKHNWYYRKEFMVPADFTGKRIRLIFDGVDNACEVWLNGKKIGGNPNMFRRFEFDVAGVIKIGETNRLEVRIERIPEVLVPYIEHSDGKNSGRGTEWWFVYGLRKTIETLKDLKSPTNFGWDWGVNIWTLGIWKDVRLEASGPAIINNLKIETPLSNNYSKANIRVDTFVDSLSKEAAKLRLKISGNGSEQILEKPISLTEGSSKLHAEIAMENPALWWPNGHGEQNLYNLEASLVDNSGKISHALQTRFGIREVRWELTSEAPADFPEKYMPVVNGRKIRMIGSNLIPPDLLFARIPERAPHLLRMAKALGFTTLRIWGGGVIFSPEVYDLADELGIMLELEMPMASLDPIPDPDLLKNLESTLPNIIRQVWNHPSIIEYTGGNEMRYGRGNYPPFGESKDRNQMGYDSAVDFTFVEHIRKIFAQEDPGRVFRDTDPVKGGAHSPWHSPLTRATAEDPLGLYSRWNFIIPYVPDKSGKVPTGPRSHIYPVMRHGEFGNQTAGHLESWQRTIPPSSQWPIVREDPILIRKNVTHAVFDEDAWLEKPVIDFLFGKSPDLETLLKAGQYVGAEGLRYAIDAIRRRGTATGGMMTWDFNEPWTNGAGSFLIDYDGRPLMNGVFAKQASAQLSLSLRHTSSLYSLSEGVQSTLYLSSDAPYPVKDLAWSWKARDRRGSIIASGDGTVGIDPIKVKKLADIAVDLPDKTAFGPVLIELQLSDSQGKVVHERVHIFGLQGVRAPLKGLLARNLLDTDDDPEMLRQLFDATGKANSKQILMPEVSRPVKQTSLQVDTTATRREGREEVLDLVLTNSGAMTALFCEPKPVLNYRTDLIIENLYVCIPPGETRILSIRAPLQVKDGLTLNQTGWRIESWNADPVEIKPSEDLLLSLGRKDRMCREFAGYPGLNPLVSEKLIRVEGRRPDPGKIPNLLDDTKTVQFTFDGASGSQGPKAMLRIHSSDQSTTGALLSVELNGKTFEVQIPEGFGFQNSDPAQLARTQTTELIIPADLLKQQDNKLRIQVLDGGWFTWDALDLKSAAMN